MKIPIMYQAGEMVLTPLTKEIIDSTIIKSNYRCWFNDQRVTGYSSHGVFPMYESQVDSFFQGIENQSITVFAIMVKEDSEYIHIGNVSIQSINLINRSAELAIILGEPGYWGKGYGTKACDLTILHAFHKMGLERVWLGTLEYNKGMVGIAEKIGMKKEGRLRKAAMYRGDLHDVYMYSIIRGDV